MNTSTALATFVERPSPRYEVTPSSLSTSSVISPVVCPKKSGVSGSGMAKVAGNGTSANISRVSWETGVKSEPVLGGNGGMAATVRSLGSVFVASKNKIQLVYVNHVHVSLAHIHSNVLKATA